MHLFIRTQRVEIEVHDVALQRVMLHVLDERESLFAAGDFEVHEDVLAAGLAERCLEFLRVELEVLRLAEVSSVDDCRDEARVACLFCFDGASARTGLRFELDCFGHCCVQLLLWLVVSVCGYVPGIWKREETDSSP